MVPLAPRRSRWLKWLAITSLIAAVIATVVVILAGVALKKVLPPNTTVAEATRVIKAAAAQPEDAAKIVFGDKQRINLLVLGIDYDYTDSDLPFSKNARSDTIFVLQLRRDGNYMGMLSMPRDMYVDFPDGTKDKVNAAYGKGGIKLERDMLTQFLGIDFDYYAVVRIDAATKLLDRIGGLDVNVEKDMNYDDNWGHLHVHLKKGQQHLNGEQAVGYARFRHDEDGDRGRMRRQQVVINALMEKLKSSSTYSDPLQLLEDVAKIAHTSLETDLKTEELVALGKVYMHFDKHNLRTAQLDGADTTADGQAVIVPPPADKVSKIVQSVIRPEAGAVTAPVDVEVLNGSKFPDAARQVQKALEAKGFHIIYVGAAPKAEPTTRAVAYTLDDAQRAQLAMELAPFSSGTVSLVTPLEAGPEWQANPNFTDVTILLGDDYVDPHAKPKSRPKMPPPVTAPSTDPSASASP